MLSLLPCSPRDVAVTGPSMVRRPFPFVSDRAGMSEGLRDDVSLGQTGADADPLRTSGALWRNASPLMLRQHTLALLLPLKVF